MTYPLLTLDNLCIAYPQSHHGQQWSVEGVSLKLEPGERLGLVGESGCGKSTIGKAILRLLPQQSQIQGDIKYQGESILSLTPHQLRLFRGEVVSLVFQDPMTRLDPIMSIGEHCLETLYAHQPQLSRLQAQERASEILEKVKVPPNRWSQYPHEFSGGMRQRVAIALSLLLNPKLIIADEPTTSLDVTVASEILQELTRLCAEEQRALLLISHDLAMVGEYCDNLAVMYQGKLVEYGAIDTVFSSPSHGYTRSLLQSAIHLQTDQRENPQKNPSSALLEVKNLKQYFTLEGNFLEQWLGQKQEVIKAVDDVSFTLYKGETLGLVGESGCGKSTLSRTILQLIPPTSGKVAFYGQELTGLSSEQMRPYRRHIQMIFQDPHACLNPLMTVGESIADPLFIQQLVKNPESAKKEVAMILAKVGLTPTDEFYNRYPGDLSGGQQQRVAIARALITRPQLVICDEPVSMLDATVQSQVLDLMQQLKAEFQLTYLFITHDLLVARYFCDRLGVMTQGKIVEIGATEDIFKHPQHPYTQKLLQAAPLLRFS
jgi:peptide/nickel transport system ATP-binding protein